MRLLSFWERLRGKPREGFPLLLRVRDRAGKPCRRLRIEGEWLPSGRRLRCQPLVADGLCLLPWASGAERLRATVSSDDGTGEISVERARRHPHPVLELELR